MTAGDEKGEQRHPEGAVDVVRGAARARVLGGELGVGAGGQGRQHEGERERGPDRPAHLGPDLADERVDAGSEHVSDDEDEQHRPRDAAAQRGLRGGV